MDLFEQCRSYTRARKAMAVGIYPYFLTLDGHEGTTVRHRGHEIIMCGSNNYLGLTADPRVREASRQAIDTFGPSCTGSRFLNGNLSLHEELEHELAKFFGKPAALVFSTGYQANLGTITALLCKDDVVLIDADAHASIIDGCRLSRATVRRFAHNDAEDLQRQLAVCSSDAGKLVIVDGVYSMEGDLCCLPDVVAACQQHGARLIVDDAHGAGVLGGGRGTAEHFGLTNDVDLITITFSKSFASLGGAVLGSEEVIHYIRHHARSLIFSASMTPAAAAAALCALQIAREEPWRSHTVLERADFVRTKLAAFGFDVGTSETPIVPVHIRPGARSAGAGAAESEPGDILLTGLIWRQLLDDGIYTNAVIPPAASSPRLRTSYMATHTTEQLERVAVAFAEVRDRQQLPTALPALQS